MVGIDFNSSLNFGQFAFIASLKGLANAYQSDIIWLGLFMDRSITECLHKFSEFSAALVEVLKHIVAGASRA